MRHRRNPYGIDVNRYSGADETRVYRYRHTDICGAREKKKKKGPTQLMTPTRFRGSSERGRNALFSPFPRLCDHRRFLVPPVLVGGTGTATSRFSLHSSQYHDPLGGFSRPTQARWNHSLLQSSPSHPIMFPNETLSQ